MFLDESTVTTTSTPDQIELRTDVSAPFLVESVNRWHWLDQKKQILGRKWPMGRRLPTPALD